jgi:hypothetical protein
MADKSTTATEQISRMSADASKERSDLNASLASLEDLAKGLSAMQEAVDQLTLLQRLASD